MKNYLFLLLGALALFGAGCDAPSSANIPQQPKAYTAIEAQGFTDIKLGSTPIFECAKDDSALSSYRFTAKNMNGRTISGTSCCGIFKGCTIRY